MAGLEIRKKRKLLRSAPGMHHSDRVSARASPTKTTEVQVVSELSPINSPVRGSFTEAKKMGSARTSRIANGNEYNVSVSGGRRELDRWQNTPSRARQRNSAMEANTAAWRYTKCCVLFFASLLITWLPSSVNRVYTVVWPNVIPPYGLSYAAALVLPLTGFWNSIIYVTTSWSACKALVQEDLAPFFMSEPEYQPRSATYWEPPPPSSSRPASDQPQQPVGPSRPYSPRNRWEELREDPREDSDERGWESPSDSLAGLATVARAL